MPFLKFLHIFLYTIDGLYLWHLYFFTNKHHRSHRLFIRVDIFSDFGLNYFLPLHPINDYRGFFFPLEVSEKASSINLFIFPFTYCIPYPIHKTLDSVTKRQWGTDFTPWEFISYKDTGTCIIASLWGKCYNRDTYKGKTKRSTKATHQRRPLSVKNKKSVSL